MLHVMQSRCVKPVLHIWNLEQQFPHVALVFELSRPSLDTLKAAIDAESAETVYWSGCKKILVCAEGAVPLQDNVRTLVSAFKIQGIGLALVTEKGAGEIQKTYPRISMPVQKLLTRPPSYH